MKGQQPACGRKTLLQTSSVANDSVIPDTVYLSSPPSVIHVIARLRLGNTHWQCLQQRLVSTFQHRLGKVNKQGTELVSKRNAHYHAKLKKIT